MLAIRHCFVTREFNVDEKRFIFFSNQILTIYSEKVTNEEANNRATKFLNRKDLCQIIRREICFGLVPKTLTGK